jgi:transmembrane sensor
MSENIKPGGEDNDLPFHFKKKPVDGYLQQENWKAIEAGIVQEQKPVVRLRWLRPLAVAASVALIITGTWFWQNNNSSPLVTKVTTSNGEMRRIILPDSSLVVLNANSTASIPQNWTDKGDRQLWLTGEAYFEVKKKPSTKQKFVVHTSDIDIEVLGTRFNVNTRHDQSVVSLEEGKVQLSLKGNIKEVVEAKQPLIMKPGEVAIVNADNKVSINQDKVVSYYSGWSRHEYHFDNTPLSEIARIIKDTYGYTMKAEDNSLFQKKISGDLRAANIEELIKVLEVTFKIKMIIENKTIRLQAV